MTKPLRLCHWLMIPALKNFKPFFQFGDVSWHFLPAPIRQIALENTVKLLLAAVDAQQVTFVPVN